MARRAADDKVRAPRSREVLRNLRPSLGPSLSGNPPARNSIMLVDRRRIIGTFAVVSLVLLRLVIGWHFLGEGTKKLQYDRDDGWQLAFTSEDFLRQAKGPLAPVYHARLPDEHGWRELLAAPRENLPPSDEQLAEHAQWRADYQRRRSEAAKAGEPPPFEFPPSAPYHAWATRIADDWRDTLAAVAALPGLSEEQQQEAQQAFHARLEQLEKYLAGKAEEIAEYRHELWRLANWRNSPEASDVPFVQERIVAKTGETAGQSAAWVNQVRQLEELFHNDLRAIFTSEQRADAALSDALADARQLRLRTIDRAVTALTIGVGVCLLLGLFTRVASIVGALFLLSVIASQPPWLYDAAPTMPQFIELAGLLVLAGTAAGRWMGLDLFIYALFNRRRGG